MPRNTQGGKNFKKFKTGSEGFRAKASREAVDDMIDLIIKKERADAALSKGDQRTADAVFKEEDKEALRYMVIGRVTRKFGNARVEAYCHDGKVRQCKIRGLLRKKGQVFIDNDSLVVISLREAESSSDDETGLGPSGGDPTGTSDIVGCFDDRQSAILRKTKINPRLFQSDRDAEPSEDIFDRSEIINAGGKNAIEEEGEININDI
jgi:initiation factor 1A